MTHALEPWGNAPGPVADAGADPVALEDRLADARSRRARVLAARAEDVPRPAPVLAAARPAVPRPPASRRRLRPAVLLPAFAVGLAAGVAATLLVPVLNGPPPAPPSVVVTAAALPPAPAAGPIAPQPAAGAVAALPPLPELAPPAPAALPAAAGPRLATAPPPALFVLALGTAVPPGPESASALGFDPGHLAPSVRAAFPRRSSSPVATAVLDPWPEGKALRPAAAPRATASARSNEAAAPPTNPIAALFRAIGRLANGGSAGPRR